MRSDRLLALMLLLQTYGKMTAQSLAERLEVSRRTILRDIDALGAAGVPICAEGGHGGGITLDEHYRTALVGLQEREARTLFLGDNSQPLGDLGLGDAVDRTFLKLLAVLPAAHRPSVEHMRQRVLIDPAWWWRDEQPLPIWGEIQRAVYEDRCIHVVYERSDGSEIERSLQPYSLVAKSSVWYLVADQHPSAGGELRIYRVSRFRHLEVLETPVSRRADFDLPSFWRGHLRRFSELSGAYRFTMRVNPERINLAQRIVPGRYRQLGGPEPDGWLTVQFDLESAELAQMLVFGFAHHAIVLEPAELRDTVLAMARALVAGP